MYSFDRHAHKIRCVVVVVVVVNVFETGAVYAHGGGNVFCGDPSDGTAEWRPFYLSLTLTLLFSSTAPVFVEGCCSVLARARSYAVERNILTYKTSIEDETTSLYFIVGAHTAVRVARGKCVRIVVAV